ncbi:hypothetical protein PPYR_07456 [Photinus pyralis]|uniref:Uncharacterized protein n=1 Tax=Photinus pyralis TaxID=7054 RepID=A0A1Y1MD22_PHOPY|nr:hypothetical protein PPYR_07456 [Photinus pyralis]
MSKRRKLPFKLLSARSQRRRMYDTDDEDDSTNLSNADKDIETVSLSDDQKAIHSESVTRSMHNQSAFDSNLDSNFETSQTIDHSHLSMQYGAYGETVHACQTYYRIDYCTVKR